MLNRIIFHTCFNKSLYSLTPLYLYTVTYLIPVKVFLNFTSYPCKTIGVVFRTLIKRKRMYFNIKESNPSYFITNNGFQHINSCLKYFEEPSFALKKLHRTL